MRSTLPMIVLCAALSALGPAPCRGTPLLGDLCRRPARIGGALPGAQAYAYACDETAVEPAVPPGSLEHLLLEHLVGRFLRGGASSQREPEAPRRRGAPSPKPYTVQHFRWGIKYGKKRRPVKGAHVGGGHPLADEAADLLEQEQRRELRRGDLGTPWDIFSLQQQQKQQQQQQEEEDQGPELQEEETRNFEHAVEKRYGGFMSPSEVCDKKTLLMFLRNVMANER